MIKKLSYTFLGMVIMVAGTVYAAPYFTYQTTLLPQFNGSNDLGTTTAKWRNLFLNLSDGCLQISSGLVISTGSACGAGGGGGGGTFSTSTISGYPGVLTNYPNNNTDVITIGATGTSTAKFFFDPNQNSARIGSSNTSSTTIMGIFNIPTVGQGFLYTGSAGKVGTVSTSTIFGFTPANQATTITVNGTSNQITSSAGAQDLSANRTWTLSFPNQVIFPQYASSTNGFSTPYASSTNLFAGFLTLSTSTTGCLQTTGTNGAVVIGSCSTGGTGISNPFTNSFITNFLGKLYTSATTSALTVNSVATTTIGNLGGVYYVPPDFAINGCAGNATYTDFGKCVNGLYSLASTSGNYHAKIHVPNIKVPGANWTTAINANINGLAMNLECDGSQLIWGGTGTSTVINHGNPTGHLVSEISGCIFQGNSTLIAAGNSNTKTTGGISFGGSNGGVGIDFHDNSVNGFGQNISWGGVSNGNAYMITLKNNAISGGNGNIPGNNIYIGLANNSGERNVIDSNSITDPSDNIATSSIYIADGATASNFFTNNSLDNVGVYCGTSNGMCYFGYNHWEDAGSPNNYGQYIPIVNPSSDGSTSIVLIGNEFANSASNKTWETIVKHGGQLYASGNRIDNYNGFTVTNFADHSNNNGQSSDHVCQTQVQGGSLTNIIAGGGGVAWSLTNGVPCVTNRSNSYTIGLRPLSTNVNEFFSGGSTVGTFDHSGNWFFGNTTGTTGTVTLNNLTINGTCTGCGSGSGSAYPFTPSTWNLYNTQATTSALAPGGIYISSSSDPIGNLGGNGSPGSWPAMLWSPNSITGSSTGIAFGVSSTVGGSPGAGIVFVRQGANSYGDLLFATADNGSAMSEKLRIKGNGALVLATTTSGCLNSNTSGLIYVATCATGGGITSLTVGAGHVNQGTTITSSGTITGAIATSGTIALGGIPMWTGLGDTSNPATLTSISTSTLVNNIFPFTSYGFSTTSVANFANGLMSFSSTTLNGLKLSDLSAGFAGIGGLGQVYSFATSTIKGSQITNDSAWISSVVADSPLSGSGTSGSHLVLGTVPVSKGGTNSTSFASNSIITSNSAGDTLIATGTQLTVGNILATSSATNLFRGLIQGTNITQSGANSLWKLINTNDSATDNINIQATYNGGQFCWTDQTVCQYIGKAFTGLNTIVGILHNAPVVLSPSDIYSVLDDGYGRMGIGTGTPKMGVATIASSTAPQLTLGAGAGLLQWSVRNAGGSLYFSTTTLNGTATTSTAAFGIDSVGHTLSAGGKPALTSCLTSPSIVGTDSAGTITAGTGTGTLCRITFANAYKTAPACIVTTSLPSGVAPFIGVINASTTTTTLSITNMGTTTGAVPLRMTSLIINYMCQQPGQ